MARQMQVTEWLSTAQPREIISLAIQMERGSVRQYAHLAKTSQTALLRAKFRYLAEEEREHARLLAEWRHNLGEQGAARNVPREFMAEGSGEMNGDRIADALRLAIINETTAETFYRTCAGRARGGVSEIFNQLADREARHKDILQDELMQQTGTFPWRGLTGALPNEEDFWK